MIFNSEWQKYKMNEDSPLLNIVSASFIYNRDIAYGQNISLIILDTSKNKEIEKKLLLHKNWKDGRATTRWGREEDNRLLFLKFNLDEPTKVEFFISIDIVKYASLVDSIIKSQLVYIQCGKEGDRCINTFGEAQVILAEVPSSHFKSEWEKIYFKVMTKEYQKKGYGKKQARIIAEKVRSEWNKVVYKRLK